MMPNILKVESWSRDWVTRLEMTTKAAGILSAVFEPQGRSPIEAVGVLEWMGCGWESSLGSF